MNKLSSLLLVLVIVTIASVSAQYYHYPTRASYYYPSTRVTVPSRLTFATRWRPVVSSPYVLRRPFYRTSYRRPATISRYASRLSPAVNNPNSSSESVVSPTSIPVATNVTTDTTSVGFVTPATNSSSSSVASLLLPSTPTTLTTPVVVMSQPTTTALPTLPTPPASSSAPPTTTMGNQSSPNFKYEENMEPESNV